MAGERRNLYRILHVQPEAPAAVIKASYRALMTTLGAHPDRGGQHETAAQLNVAYAVLGDPERRAAYDQTLKRPARSAPVAEDPALFDAQRWQREGRCPFCSLPFDGTPRLDSRCRRCRSPLSVAPAPDHSNPELVGRRQGERYARRVEAHIRLPGLQAALPVRLRDLSLHGLSMACPQRLQLGTIFRIEAGGIDAVAQVLACRALGTAQSIHARLLTLAVGAAATGAFVSTQA